MGRGPRRHVSAFCRASRVFKLRLRLCGADRGGRDVCDCGKSGERVAELARHGNSPFLSIGILVHRRHTGNGGQVRRFAPLVSKIPLRSPPPPLGFIDWGCPLWVKSGYDARQS